MAHLLIVPINMMIWGMVYFCFNHINVVNPTSQAIPKSSHFFMGAISTILKWLVYGIGLHITVDCFFETCIVFMSTHHSYHDAIYNHI